MLRRKLWLRMLLRKEARVLLAPTWCRRTTHTARTNQRQHTSLSGLLLSRRRILQIPKELATRAVKGGHFARDCPNRADRKAKANHGSGGSKDVNMTTLGSTEDGYGNLSTVLSVFQSISWWFDTGANVHVCADISLFSSY